MTELERMIHIMVEANNGGQVEWTTKGRNYWTDNVLDIWNWVDFDYRIKKGSAPRLEMTLSEIERELGYQVKVVS